MKRALSIVFSYFPVDPRPRREAEAMVEAGIDVDLICLNRRGERSKEKLHGVNVYRVNIKRKRGSKVRYLWEYVAFLFVSFFLALRMSITKRYDIVHVHNMPDFLVFSALAPKIMGAKVILDLHDPMPEVFMTKYNLKKEHVVIRTLKFIEKVSIKFSDIVITPNKSFRDLFVSRGCKESKIHVLMNSPMEKVFSPNLVKHEERVTENDGLAFKVMFHGYIAEHNGLTVALEAVSIVRDEIPNIRFEVFGSGPHYEATREYANYLQVNDIVNFYGMVSQDTIAQHIVKNDLGIISNLSTPFTEINFPTRIFEYLCFKKPVIAPRTVGIRDYFDEGSICYFEPGSASDLARAILELWNEPELKDQYVRRGFPIYFDKRWALQKQLLIELVEGVQ